MKSTSVTPQPSAGSNPRTRAASKPAPADDTLEFDFGAKPAAPAPTAPTPAITPISTTETISPQPTIAEKKESTPISTETKLRIHHTATPGPLAGAAKPAFASAGATQIKSKFSIDSIKITDLTGELEPEKNQSAIPMPAPATSTKPVAPPEPTIASTPVSTEKKSEPKVEPKVETKPITKSATVATASAPAKTIHSSGPVTPSAPIKTSAAPAKTISVAAVEAAKPAHTAPSPQTAATTPTSTHTPSTSIPAKSTTSTSPITHSTTHHLTHSTHSTPQKETTHTTRNSTMALNQPSVSDFRKNAERQAKEQHVVGNVLTWVAYAALGVVVLFFGLAAFGGYTLKQMIDSQSVSIAQLDARYSDQLTKQQADLAQLRAEADKLADQLAATANLMAKQQEQLKRTAASADDTSAILKARTRELSELRDRVRRLEGGHITR